MQSSWEQHSGALGIHGESGYFREPEIRISEADGSRHGETEGGRDTHKNYFQGNDLQRATI